MKRKSKFSNIAIITGIGLTLLSFLIYKFMNEGYLQSIQSEVAGVGIAILVLGIIFKFFGVKLG